MNQATGRFLINRAKRIWRREPTSAVRTTETDAPWPSKAIQCGRMSIGYARLFAEREKLAIIKLTI